MNKKRTNIICTIGPSSQEVDFLQKLVNTGLNLARLNFSHGSYETHQVVIDNIRQASEILRRPIGIIQDLMGPRIRIGLIDKEGVILKKGEDVILEYDSRERFLNNKSIDKIKKIPHTYPALYRNVKVGQRILLVDGLISLKVKKIVKKQIYCQVKEGGKIFPKKGINLPDSILTEAVITIKDKKDLDFGLKNKVDFVAMSFVRTEQDILDLKNILARKCKDKIKPLVIAKIENKMAVKNINKIIEVADAIMVARGDLGVELNPVTVPVIQKKIIARCIRACKPVIVATQMLESMINNPTPTRAEVSDVANAVIDHTDCVMLSGETASGKYPVKSVQIMADTIRETEKSVFDNLNFLEVKNIGSRSYVSSLLKSIDWTSVDKVFIVCSDVKLAQIFSSLRIEKEAIALTSSERIEKQLLMSWGIKPYLVAKEKWVEAKNNIKEYAQKEKLISKQEKIIIIDEHILDINLKDKFWQII